MFWIFATIVFLGVLGATTDASEKKAEKKVKEKEVKPTPQKPIKSSYPWHRVYYGKGEFVLSRNHSVYTFERSSVTLEDVFELRVEYVGTTDMVYISQICYKGKMITPRYNLPFTYAETKAIHDHTQDGLRTLHGQGYLTKEEVSVIIEYINEVETFNFYVNAKNILCKGNTFIWQEV